jgi:hypothetical protein
MFRFVTIISLEFWAIIFTAVGHVSRSLVFETGGTIPAEAIFLEYREASGEILSPELFPRADGTTSA